MWCNRSQEVDEIRSFGGTLKLVFYDNTYLIYCSYLYSVPVLQYCIQICIHACNIKISWISKNNFFIGGRMLMRSKKAKIKMHGVKNVGINGNLRSINGVVVNIINNITNDIITLEETTCWFTFWYLRNSEKWRKLKKKQKNIQTTSLTRFRNVLLSWFFF